MRFFQGVFIIFVFLTGCKGQDKVVLAKEQVQNFRQMYKNAMFGSIYAESSGKMKLIVSEGGFEEFMVSAKAELGDLVRTDLINTNSIKYVIGKPSVVLTYSSEYVLRNVTET
uniref:hypothetical protein n=1 Tax=Serratia marcescens TaxID=615 RepID=UPI0011E62789